MLQLLLDVPIQLPQTKETLTSPSKKGEVHPLHPKLKLLTVFSPGRQSTIENLHKKLKLSQTRGKHLQDCDMSLYSNDGNAIHFRGMRINILLVYKAYSSFSMVLILMVSAVIYVQYRVP